VDWFPRMVATYGGAAIFLLSFLENIGLPVPAFPFFLLAGGYSAAGVVSLPLILAGAVAGAVGADLIWYRVGKWRGKGVLSFLCRMSLNPDVCVESAVDNFHRQERLNRMLIACIEELAVENAQLRRDLVRLGERATPTS